MKIKTLEEMNSFCEIQSNKSPFKIELRDIYSGQDIKEIENIQDELIKEGIIPKKPISHLQQGIIFAINLEEGLFLEEIPLLFPNPNILNRPELKNYFGAMTGVLVNCYDPKNKTLLLQMRGKNIDSPFGFQVAAAGMGVFRENPYFTARRELAEEQRILYPSPLFGGLCIGCFPFMKGQFPQPLFSFGFTNDLSNFPNCNSLEDITEFEQRIKGNLRTTGEKPKEAYGFTIPLEKAEEIAVKINEQKRFFGPIYGSTKDFLKKLEL